MDGDGYVSQEEFLQLANGRNIPGFNQRRRRALRELLKQTVEFIVSHTDCFSTNACIMSFQQAIRFWNWCWILNGFFVIFWVQPSFAFWDPFKLFQTFISFQLKRPLIVNCTSFRSNFEQLKSKKETKGWIFDTNFNVQLHVEMTWSKHIWLKYRDMYIVLDRWIYTSALWTLMSTDYICNINHNTCLNFYYFRFHTNISIKINTHASHHRFSWFVSAYFKLSFLVTTAMLEALVWTGPFFIVHISYLTLTKDTKFGDIWPTC